MQAEIIAVGSEMLTPERTDTDSLYLTRRLNDLGVEVVGKHIVGDDRGRIADIVRRAAAGSGIVILTGGLGPTEDDLTREAVSDALDRKLIFHEEISLRLEERFRQLGRKMTKVNQRQAFMLEGAHMLANDRGTAPGQWVEEGGSVIILLPGPPHEMEAMFERECLGRLQRLVPKLVIRTLLLRVADMPESDLDQLISPVYKKYTNPATTILAGGGDIQIHLRACCGSEAEAMALLSEVSQPIQALLGDRVYSANGDALEVVVGQMLRNRRATLAVAESCTGGMLAERITQVPGSSEYFAGGFVTYTNRMKKEMLGVSEETLAEYGAVSAQTAEAMAIAARRCTGAAFALSITGVAGPEGGTTGTPVGTVFMGLADPGGCQVRRRQFLGDRARIRGFATQLALDLLRRRCATLSM